MKRKVDINCDLGESYGIFTIGNDDKVMPHVTSANVACGFHAGDPRTMIRTIDTARKLGIAVGAHPGFPDLMGFGRREMQLTSEEAIDYVAYQVSAIQGLTKAAGLKLQHVKPHGAMYNMATKDQKLSQSIAEAVLSVDSGLIIFAPRKSELAKASEKARLGVAFEFFADRAYSSDGSLVSRTNPNSIIVDPRRVVERSVMAVTAGIVQTVGGESFNLGDVHTICVHGDTPNAAKLAADLRKGLARASIEAMPVSHFL